MKIDATKLANGMTIFRVTIDFQGKKFSGTGLTIATARKNALDATRLLDLFN